MTRKHFLYLYLLSAFFSVNIATGQHVEYDNLRFVDVKNGISKKPISSVIEDNSGYIWLSTQGDGIFRFDGTNYENYTYHYQNQSSIESNIVYSLYIDSKKQLWAGTNNGLSVYNKDLNRFESIDFKNLVGIEGTLDVICLIEDDDNNLILGTDYKGAFKMPLDGSHISKINTPSIDVANLIFKSLTKNQQGDIYAGTNEGLFTLDTASNVFKNQITPDQDEFITCTSFDNNNNLWFGTLTGNIYKFDKQNNKATLILQSTERRIFSLLFIDDYLLIGTELDGLMAYHLNTKKLHKYVANTLVENSLGSMSIWKVFADSQKRLWVGTFEQGVQMVDRFNSKFNSIEYIPGNSASLQGASIAGIQQDSDGKLWIGAPGGVDIYDPKTNEIEHINNKPASNIKGLTSTAILGVLIDHNDGLWVGTWDKGIYYLKKDSKRFVNYNTDSQINTLATNAIFDFAEDAKGNIFIASFLNGIHYYNASKKKIIFNI